MALICPVCNAENREGAIFCKSCGGKLAPPAPAPIVPPPPPEGRSEREWAATAPAQLRAPTIPGGLFDARLPLASQAPDANAATGPADEKTVIVGTGRSKRPPSPPREPRVKKASRPRTPRPAATEARKPSRLRGAVLWLVLLAAGLLMIVAGWHGYGKGKPAEQAEAPAPAVPAPVAAPAIAPAAAPEAPPPALEPQPAEPPTAVDAAPAAAATATSAAASPKPSSASAKPRKPAPTAPPQPGAPEPAPTPAAAPAPQPAAAGPADPVSICGDRNFIAKAQCMAAQCLKPEFKPHAQCEAVRRQQRIEEEKRNPTLVN
jgi:hypothetical protein